MGGADKKVEGELNMPGGVPGATGANRGGGGGGGGDRACAALGEGSAKHLAKLREALRAEEFARRCQARSGLLELLGLRRRLRSCAVVGGSGILKQHPLGAEIDEAEAVFRVNNCPTRGFEDLAGGRTTFRFLNSPRSMRWAKDVKERPKPISLSL